MTCLLIVATHTRIVVQRGSAVDPPYEGFFSTLLEVQSPTRLSYTWRWTEGPLDRSETLVELGFVPERGGVTVHLCHSRFANQDECDRHVGWTQAFEVLAEWLR